MTSSFEAQQKMAKSRNKVLSKVAYLQDHNAKPDVDTNKLLSELYRLYNDYEKDRVEFIKTLEHEGGVK